jgi:hypothetical protein
MELICNILVNFTFTVPHNFNQDTLLRSLSPTPMTADGHIDDLRYQLVL